MSDDENNPATEAWDFPLEELGEHATSYDVNVADALPDNVINLLTFMLRKGDKYKIFVEKTLPEQIEKHITEDLDGRSGWIEPRAERMKLWLGNLEPKAEPYANCANMHLPILLERTLRLESRIWAQIFRDGQPVFSAQPSSAISKDTAEIVTKHQDWQFRKEIPDFPSHVHCGLMEFIRDGDVVFFSTRDQENGVNRHVHLSVDEFIYPYTRRSMAPDMSDVPHKTRVMFLYRRDLLKMQSLGIYEQVDKVLAHGKGSFESEDAEIIKETTDRFEGVDPTAHTSDAPYRIYEYYGWAKIPGADEIPVRVAMDAKSKVILGIFSRYYDDPKDRARFDKQSQEFDTYQASVAQHAHAMGLESQLLSTLQHPSVPQDESLAVAQQVQKDRPPPPVPPQWMESDETGLPKPPKPCKQKIIEPFSHGCCIWNPDGSHGLGVGMLLVPFQMQANIALNQFIDQATLSNSFTGFIHKMVKLPTGTTTINPNELVTVDGIPPDGVEKAFFQWRPPPANQQLLEAVTLAQESADGVSSAPDVLSGEKSGDETYRGQATRVEQAVQQLSVFAANFILVLSQVAKNNALLNYQFLPDEQLQDVMDPATQQMQQVKIGRDMYKDDFNIIFSADLSFASEAARKAEADDVLGMLTKAIPPQLAPVIVPPTIYAEAVRNCFRARGLYAMASMVYSDEVIQQRFAAQSAPPPGAQPGGPPAPGAHPGAPPQAADPHAPSIPTGTPNQAPGAQPPQHTILPGTPAQAAQNQ
jgi:hypothetical protein